MARPIKWRRVEQIPKTRFFEPVGSSIRDFGENLLKIEELEAIRLKDMEELEQEECAVKMEVSRQTFQRILSDGRKKIADSLINGKAIRIEGGNFTLNICTVECMACGEVWQDSYENVMKFKQGQKACPKCGSRDIHCVRQRDRGFCRGRCHGHGRIDID